jgi:hypothetical protein
MNDLTEEQREEINEAVSSYDFPLSASTCVSMGFDFLRVCASYLQSKQTTKHEMYTHTHTYIYIYN